MKAVKKHWAKVAAVAIFLYVFFALYHVDEFGALRRYSISDESIVEGSSYYGQPALGYRKIVLRGVKEQQVYDVVSREFSPRNGWNKPYVERGKCFVYETYKGSGSKATADDYVIVVAHFIAPDSKVVIERTRPLSPLATGIENIREFLRDQWRH